MFNQGKVMVLHCVTPLHAGTGSEVDIVDLPVQREKHTGFPKIEASGLKGCLRSSFENDPGTDAAFVKAAFGPSTKEAGDNGSAGAMGFTDGRILFFPVKSVRGVFAWVTCPAVVSRFVRDLQAVRITADWHVQPNTCTPSTLLSLPERDGWVVLEEYSFQNVSHDNGLDAFLQELWENYLPQSLTNSMERSAFVGRVMVVDDDTFANFTNLGTEVVTRIKIDPATGTVAKGALFTEEFVPAEAIFYNLVFASDLKVNASYNADKLAAAFSAGMAEANWYVQLGGDAGIGKGITCLRLGGE